MPINRPEKEDILAFHIQYIFYRSSSISSITVSVYLL